MLKELNYIASFNTTGRTLKNQISFKPGITVIKGENEAGKSFIFEMIRYALFGTDALRGGRSLYDKLEVELLVEIKGKDYHIIRKGNSAKVNINEAVGVTATNNLIKKAFGFGLDVFDISCHAMQGELDRLTKDMRATERRQMIDRIVGLNLFEAAEKECREQTNVFRRLAESLSNTLVEPVEPEKPDDYEESKVLQARLDEQTRNEARRAALVEVAQPVKPTALAFGAEVIGLHQKWIDYDRDRSRIESQLAKLPEPPASAYTPADLQLFKRSLEQEGRGPLPSGYTREELEEWRHAHILRQNQGEPLVCGNCGEIVQGQALPDEPLISLDEIEEEFKRKQKWEGFAFDSALPKSPLSLLEIEADEAARASNTERLLLTKQLSELGNEPQSYVDEVAEFEAWDKADAEYENKLQLYDKYLKLKSELDSLPQSDPLLREKYEMAVRYESLLDRFNTLSEIYDAQLTQVIEAEENRDGYKKGNEALKDIRKEVKQYLIPSLAKASSILLQEMTDGERRDIKIDEDFEITVDKQPVSTLSGSGVSVVNLAIRIALGQVLTQSVIPVFLADEIDANMAERRTKATYKGLTRLKKRLKQIIVITHKEFEGDHLICLK